MNARNVVITGIGVVSSNGLGTGAFTEGLCTGRSGISAIDAFDTSMLKTHFAATVRGFDPLQVMAERDVRRVPRLVPFAVAAAKEALGMAGLAEIDDAQSRRIGVTLGSGGGGLEFVEAQYRAYFTGEGKYSPFTITSGTHGNLSSELSIQLGLRGPSHVITTGCASSTDALGYAMMHIRAGHCPMMLSGGADAPIAEGIIKGFELMRILAGPVDPVTRASRPFCKDRDGFVVGEGAWMFVLEDAEHAARRGATVLAELCGWGSTCDAFHRVQPAPDCDESVRAIDMALADAGVSRMEIEYVNLHGTSTAMNDALETRAMKKCFGDRAYAIPMSATKSMIGHPQGACGAAGLAATILSLRKSFLHPTINLDKPDPECDLDYVTEGSRPSNAQWALCNCIAFGSKNSALVVRVAR
jgi:3-oxoacyl-[acyl-carrier-protein] synthase II